MSCTIVCLRVCLSEIIGIDLLRVQHFALIPEETQLSNFR